MLYGGHRHGEKPGQNGGDHGFGVLQVRLSSAKDGRFPDEIRRLLLGSSGDYWLRARAIPGPFDNVHLTGLYLSLGIRK